MSKPNKPRKGVSKITVAVLEDDETTLEGIRYQLEKPDIHICGIGDNLDDFLLGIKTCRPMVGMVDLRVGNDHEAGFKAIQKGQEVSPETKFIVFTAYDELEYFEKAIKLGVKAFLVKRADELSPENAVRIVASGGSYFGEIWSEYLSKVKENPPVLDLKNEETSPTKNKLTRRELEILKLLDEGKQNKQIALKLNLSVHTIKAHTNNLRKKMGVNSTPEAIRKARLWELIDNNPPDKK